MVGDHATELKQHAADIVAGLPDPSVAARVDHTGVWQWQGEPCRRPINGASALVMAVQTGRLYVQRIYGCDCGTRGVVHEARTRQASFCAGVQRHADKFDCQVVQVDVEPPRCQSAEEASQASDAELTCRGVFGLKQPHRD